VKEKQHHRDSSILVTEHTYDALGNRTSTRDHFENVTLFEYDEFGRQTKVIHPKCLSCDGQAFSPTVQYQYDIVGNIVSEIDGLDNSTKTTYNIRGKPITISYSDGSQERFEYNLDGTLAKKWEKDGVLCQYTYDGLQRITQHAYYDIDGTILRATHNIYAGALLTHTIDAMGNITEYHYDGAGRKIAEVQPGSRTTFGYDTLGRLSTTTRWLDEYRYTQEVQDFDVLDRVIECRVEDETGKILRKERYAYDIRDNKTLTETFIDEGTSSITETRYDTRNKPISIQDALGNITTIHNFERHPNPFGGYLFSKTTTDPLGNQTIEVYDPLGRPITVEKRNIANQRLSYQSVYYDPAGNKELQQEVIYASGIVRGSYTVDWTHDSMGRPLVITESGSDDSHKITKHSYDQRGRLQTITKPDGVVLNHQYDTLGRLKQLTSSDSTISYLYEYDLNDNLLTSTDCLTNGATQRSYDPQNRLIQETLANGLGLIYSYDAFGRLSSVMFPDSANARYHYDATNLLSVKRISASGNVLYTHQYSEHDLRGLHSETTLIGNAGHANLTYDLLGRRKALDAPHWSESIPEEGFDAVGNLTEIAFTNTQSTITNHYQYDDLYQLIDESGGTPHTYAYDSINNRLAKDNQLYTVNGLNQITRASSAAYAYDPNGNLTAKTTSDSSLRYCYDALNRMTRAEGLYGTVSYTYDSFGRRISETHEEDTTHYLYQGQCEIGAYFNGDLRELRILGKGKGAELGAAIAIEIADKVYAPIHDHRGNVCCLVDCSTCQPEQYYRYTAFGETISYGNVENPWQYASKRFDEWTGFHRFGKRDYDCRLGRWLTPDPAGFVDGPNLYAYVHNSPLTFFDPWGLQSVEAESCHRRSREYAQGCQNTISKPLQTGNKWLGYCRDCYHAIRTRDFSQIRQRWENLRPEEQGRFVNERAGELTVALVALVPAARIMLRTSGYIYQGYDALNRTFSKNSTEPVAVTHQTSQVTSAEGPVTSRTLETVNKNVEKNRFPEDPNDLLPELPRDDKGYIYPATNLRIRCEKHVFKEGDTYCARHHELHYHVEARRNLENSSWKSRNRDIFTPENYQAGEATGFLPGEKFPGELIRG
ncbi:RHS repeat domain-containing protein, partial [Undibacterium sp.]|uniref:RHS repeat domain-containing protein n=1 Tax=Undibacterium sp. TaxID=1914977 RepID=UPI0027303310